MIDLAAANHTGRELGLMLRGRKPFAMFYAEVSELPDERFIPEAAFEPHVRSGLFTRDETIVEDARVHPKLGRKARCKYVFFASREEAWRIPAMTLLLHAREKGGWNETCERIECTLLGYTDEETDAWCAHVFRPAT